MAKILLLRLFEYFKRAHSAYFSFIIQIFNFTNLFFLLLIAVGILKPILSHYLFLLLLLITVYLPVSIIIGKWDFKHGSYITLSMIAREHNPIYQELFKQLDRLEEKVNQIRR